MGRCVLVIINPDDLDDRHVGVYESTARAHKALVRFVNDSPIGPDAPIEPTEDGIARAFGLIATETPYRVLLESGVEEGAPLEHALSD